MILVACLGRGIFYSFRYVVAVLFFSKSVFGLRRTCLNAFTTENPFLGGTNLLEVSTRVILGLLNLLTCKTPEKNVPP